MSTRAIRHEDWDWLTGNVQFKEGPGTGDQTAESHMPGHSRIAIAYVPEEFKGDWLLRGPHGQVKLAVDDDGVVTDYYAYSSLGNRTDHSIYQGTGILPAYLDGDQTPIGNFEQMKVGTGAGQDMTQMVGTLDSPKESGAAGEGASGNPDVQGTGNATFLQDNGRQGFYAGGKWHDTGFHTLPAHLPGTGSDKAPTGAPPTAQDQATQADKRLSGTWGPQKFHGPKPGNQTGSRAVDDYRDMFQPLPAYLTAGGVTGPSGFAPGGRMAEIVPIPMPLPTYPAGPSPMLPNPDGDGGDGGGGHGNTTPPRGTIVGGTEAELGLIGSDYDRYHEYMEDATGGDFARREPDSSSGGSSSSGGGSGSGGRRENPDYDQAGVKEAIAILERRLAEAINQGNQGLADSIRDQIAEQKRQIDESGTPADQASYWIEVGIAAVSAFLPDPVGDAVTAALCSKAAAAAGGLIGRTIRRSGDELYDGLNLTRHIPKGADKIDNVVKGAVTAGDSAAEAARKAGVDIPEGYVPRRARNDDGWVWQHPDDVGKPGGENINSVRVGAQNEKNPTGYVRYYNEHNQPQIPGGGSGSRAETHIPVGSDTSPPPGWPKRKK